VSGRPHIDVNSTDCGRAGFGTEPDHSISDIERPSAFIDIAQTDKENPYQPACSLDLRTPTRYCIRV
jgi:hypothetical protein